MVSAESDVTRCTRSARSTARSCVTLTTDSFARRDSSLRSATFPSEWMRRRLDVTTAQRSSLDDYNSVIRWSRHFETPPESPRLCLRGAELRFLRHDLLRASLKVYLTPGSRWHKHLRRFVGRIALAGDDRRGISGFCDAAAAAVLSYEGRLFMNTDPTPPAAHDGPETGARLTTLDPGAGLVHADPLRAAALRCGARRVMRDSFRLGRFCNSR